MAENDPTGPSRSDKISAVGAAPRAAVGATRAEDEARRSPAALDPRRAPREADERGPGLPWPAPARARPMLATAPAAVAADLREAPPVGARELAAPEPDTQLVFGRMSRVELRRRLWHMVPGLLPFVLAMIPHERPLPWQALARVVALAAVLTAAVLFVYRTIARPGERHWVLNVVSYPATVLLMLLLFPGEPEFAMVVLVVLAFGDGSATLLGLLCGRRPLPWNPQKTWVGTLAFLSAAAPLAALAYWEEARPAAPYAAAVCGGSAALLGAVAESLPTYVTDNLRVGAAAAAAVVIAHTLVIGW